MPKPRRKLVKPAPTEAEWWRASELERKPHEILDNLVRQIQDDQEARYQAYREYARLYGAESDMFGNDDSFSVLRSDSVSQNELGATIDTLHAQVFKNRIVPACASNEADYEEWSRAKGFSRWIEGVQDAAELHYDAMPRAGLDALVYGTGFIQIGHDEDEDGLCTLRYDRVDPRMVLVDRLEARCGKPRNMYRKDYVDMYQLAEDYSEDGEGLVGTAEERITAILNCKPNDDIDMALGSKLKTNMLTVWEAWHLPTKKGKKDGRHVIWVKGCTLVDEAWEWDRFPFTVIRYGRELEGFYGKSAVKILAPTQKNHDKLNRKIDEAQDIMCVPRIILLDNAELSYSTVDDIPGRILRVSGGPNSIHEWNASAMSPEIYQERAAGPDKMRSLLGVSQFDTQNQLPNALREVSGPALERLIDSGTARHAMFHGELERATKDLAYLSMDYAAELEDQGKDITVVAPGSTKTSVELLSFADVKIDRKRLKLTVMPMNQMPQTFAGKVEQFSKLRESGDIDSKTYLKMLEVPDIGGQSDFLGSSEEIIIKNLHFMVKKGKYLPPLQYDNLELIVSLTTSFINWYRIREDADLEVVGMLGQYIEDALALQGGLGTPDPAAPPPAPAGMPGMPPDAGLAPPGDPMALPDMGGMPPGGPMMPPGPPEGGPPDGGMMPAMPPGMPGTGLPQ